MGAFLLDAGAVIACPHGGKVTVVPRATRVKLGGRAPLLAEDVNTVAGCGSTSPCLKVQWTGGATKVTIEGGTPLLSSSRGMCMGAGGPQGTAIVTGFQTRASAR
jgi:hypothetical protein